MLLTTYFRMAEHFTANSLYDAMYNCFTCWKKRDS